MKAHPETIGLQPNSAVNLDKQQGQQENLQSTLQSTLQSIIDNPVISYKELAEKLKIDRSAVAKRIRKLKDMGILRREGSDKNSHWVIINQEKAPEES